MSDHIVLKVYPRCIKKYKYDFNDVIIQEIHNREDHCAYFGLHCNCGGNHFNILGYNAESEFYPGTNIFIGPLALNCIKCNNILELIDPGKDGYDGENNSSVTMIGTGNRVYYKCAHCSENKYKVAVGFEYSFDKNEFDDFPEINERIQDYFSWFTLYGKCICCNNFSIITDFECA